MPLIRSGRNQNQPSLPTTTTPADPPAGNGQPLGHGGGSSAASQATSSAAADERFSFIPRRTSPSIDMSTRRRSPLASLAATLAGGSASKFNEAGFGSTGPRNLDAWIGSTKPGKPAPEHERPTVPQSIPRRRDRFIQQHPHVAKLVGAVRSVPDQAVDRVPAELNPSADRYDVMSEVSDLGWSADYPPVAEATLGPNRYDELTAPEPGDSASNRGG